MLLFISYISGKVISEDGKPVPYAYVSCGKLSTYTDENGYFMLNEDEGCILEVSHVSFKKAVLKSRRWNVIILKSDEIKIDENVVLVKNSRDETDIGTTPERELNDNVKFNLQTTAYGFYIARSGFLPRYVNVFIDGMPIYGRTFEGIDIFSLSLEDVESVELDDAPNYASVGGVLNFRTRRGRYWKTSLFSDGGFNLSYSFGKPFEQKLNFSRREFGDISYTHFGTSFKNSFKFGMDISMKNSYKVMERTNDVRTYFKWKNFYFNYFNHRFYKRKGLKSATDEYFISFEDKKYILKKHFALNLLYGFRYDIVRTTLVSGLKSIYELYTTLSYTNSYLNSHLKLFFTNGKFIIAPSLDLHLGRWRIGVNVGYRYPSVKELYMFFDHSELGYKVEGNANLQSEYSISSEVSLYMKHISLSFTYSKLWNFIDAVLKYYDENGIPVYTYENRSSFNLYIHTGSFKYRYISVEWLLSNGTFQTPKLKLSAGLTFKGLNLKYLFVDETEFSPSYSKFSVEKFINLNEFRLNFGVDDVFGWTNKLNVPYFKGRLFYVEVFRSY